MNENDFATEAATDPSAIRHEIEATRARIAETTEALAYKADVPARVKEQVDARVDAAKSAAIEVAADAASALGAAATVASERVRDADARGVLKRIAAYPRKNPLGFALGLLAFGFVFGFASPGRRR